MNDQMALYDWIDGQAPVRARARKSDPWTSHAAAKSITPGSSEGRVLDALRFGPLTDEELEDVLAGPTRRGTLTTARSRLSKAGLVESCGSKPNSRGRSMLIWRLAGE